MSFKEEARSIFLQYRAELKQGLNELAGHDPLDQALTSIIDLVDKELTNEAELLARDKMYEIVKAPNGEVEEMPGIEYIQAISVDDMRAKLKGVNNG